MKATVLVRPKEGILDPQGRAVEDSLRKLGFAVLVEGYFDFAQLFQSQAAPAVASCGTALTPQQAQLLRRFTSKVILSFDPDAAGLGAAVRSCEMLVAEGFNVNVVVLKSVLPDSSLDAEFFPGMVKKWGLGFMINTETAPTGRSAGSLAWAGLANTYFWIDPTKNIAGVILMQLLPFADPQALQTFAEFESRLYKVA